MAEMTGKNGAVKIVATGGAVAELCNVRSWKLTETASTIDTTGMCDNGVLTNIPGPVQFSGSISALWETTETDVVGNPPLVRAGAIIDFSLYPDDTLTNLKWSGTATITSVSIDCPYDGVVTFEIEFAGTGTLTKPTAHT